MSEKVTVRTLKLGTWIIGRRWTSIEKRFLEGQSSPQSNALWFASGTLEHWYSWGQTWPL